MTRLNELHRPMNYITGVTCVPSGHELCIIL